MDRRFLSNMMASFHQAKPVDPHSVVVVKKPAKTSSKVVATPSTPQQMAVGTKAKNGEVIKKKKKKPPSGTLSVEAVIAKRKRKEERKLLKEAAAAQGQRPETSQESVVGRTTSASEIVLLPDVTPVQQLPESQTPTHLASNPPAIRKKPKKPKKDKRPNVEPSRAVEVPVAQAVGPEIIEILDTDDEDVRPTTLVSHPSRAPTIQVSSSGAAAAVVSSSGMKKKKVSSSKEKTFSTSHIPSMNATAIASSSSREKTPIPQTSSPNTTIAIISPSSTMRTKKVSSSEKKSQKAEKAARKQARAERRARKAERRAKRAGKDKDKDSAAAVTSTGFVAALDVGGATDSARKQGKKKDKQKKTLRAAWAPGGRKEIPIVIEEERERSPSPLLTVEDRDRKEREAEDRFNLMMLEVGNAAIPVKRPDEEIEEAWKMELRCSVEMTNVKLAEKGVKLRKGRFSQTEKAIMLTEVERFRKAHGMSHAELQNILTVKTRKTASLRRAAASHVVRNLPGRTLKLTRATFAKWFHSQNNGAAWTEAQEDEVWGLTQMYPRQWTKIGSLVDRDPDAVHLRYQSYILPRKRGGANVKGPWSEAEDQELTKLITDQMHAHGWSITEPPPRQFSWSQVAENLTRWRPPYRCKDRWYSALLRRHWDPIPTETRISC
ncbi:hypothetical protein HD553DRAFT_309333 [Filobasidium floriforme]|uniref:uncharacterized protein n=1 Tax=Filobasidium floriforme TaxID=5210 RepID=UPI001E8E2287|nr:uncharacterized protein HD553DRAFT_309333 [Filobasidium floriforme]KAH8086302.1 hypothetical protein HD553DRAFT_309333 [Filobasidium floriforme]